MRHGLLGSIAVLAACCAGFVVSTALFLLADPPNPWPLAFAVPVVLFVVAGITNVRGFVLLALWDAFKREGIEIPSPIQDVRLAEPACTAAGREDQSIVPGDHPA